MTTETKVPFAIPAGPAIGILAAAAAGLFILSRPCDGKTLDPWNGAELLDQYNLRCAGLDPTDYALFGIDHHWFQRDHEYGQGIGPALIVCYMNTLPSGPHEFEFWPDSGPYFSIPATKY